MIVAACGSDGDLEGLGLQGVEEGGPSGAKGDKSQSQHDQQPSSSSIVSTPVEIDVDISGPYGSQTVNLALLAPVSTSFSKCALKSLLIPPFECPIRCRQSDTEAPDSLRTKPR
ncbi:hypothetical protein [Bradyrhizobium japonicum]|uniref:hypothetical protein n=1 Tax=Bradyrhizobium japonicum TaxID=375 RepID=UPI001BA5ACB4|nr:hypothetical protein [Bradyrhizobium japonicum]MCS3538904.1 hypothetical protein [Bradyrhizobium japonicum]